MNLKEMFSTVQTILVIDWPSREVPETLARAGFHVVVRGGRGLKTRSWIVPRTFHRTSRRTSHRTLTKWWSATLAARQSVPT
jgi:hypothetical protein